jgi:putative ABC transport system permease protein
MSFAALQVRRSLARRAGRLLPAVVALLVAAGAVGALGSLASDVARKMRTEFRRRGANAVARAASGSAIPGAVVASLRRDPAVEKGLPIRVASEIAGLHRLTEVSLEFRSAGPFASAWNVRGRLPDGPGLAAAGSALARRMDWKIGQEIALGAGGARTVRLVGIVTTGEGEDDELFTDVPDESRDSASAVLLRLGGEGAVVSRTAASLERRFGVRVDPILAVSASEGRVVERLRGLLAAVGTAVAILAALGTGTTLLASVVQRRREIALEKSLGADRGRILARFALEALALGLVGGVLGAVAGRIAAGALERGLFGVGLSPSMFWSVAPVALSAAIAVASSAPAVRRALAIEPITALREE